MSTALSWGIVLGVLRWFVLRGRVGYAAWWIGINVAARVPALAGIAAPALTGLQLEPWSGSVIAGATLLLPSVVAGGDMVWLLRQTGGCAA